MDNRVGTFQQIPSHAAANPVATAPLVWVNRSMIGPRANHADTCDSHSIYPLSRPLSRRHGYGVLAILIAVTGFADAGNDIRNDDDNPAKESGRKPWPWWLTALCGVDGGLHWDTSDISAFRQSLLAHPPHDDLWVLHPRQRNEWLLPWATCKFLSDNDVLDLIDAIQQGHAMKRALLADCRCPHLSKTGTTKLIIRQITTLG